MDPDLPSAEAVAVLGEDILHVGADEETLALAGPETQLIDLGGRTLIPGFVDASNHIFWGAETMETVEEAQQYLFASGVTTIGDPAVWPDRVEPLQAAEQAGNLRVRTSVYSLYNTKCDGVLEEDWFLMYPPILDPTRKLRFLGIIIIADPAGVIGPNACGWAAMSVPLPPEFVDDVGGGPYGADLFSVEEMAEVIATNQARGYQVAFHARGDVTVESVLKAIETALDGQPNEYRHRIDHNDFIRPDLLTRYAEIGAIPLIRGRPSACIINDNGGVHRFGEEVQPWFFRVRSLLDANPGLPVAWHSDMVGFVKGSWRPALVDFYDLVTRRAIRRSDGTICEPPEWFAAEAVSVEEALRIMTINGAYALFMEEKVGSLETGKFADLVVFSEDLLDVDPKTLIDVEVLMTMAGGRVEHCGQEDLCPASAQSLIEPTPESASPDGTATITAAEPRPCDEFTCYDLAVTCRGLPSRQVTVRAAHQSDAKGTVVSVGGGFGTYFYGGKGPLSSDGYETYALAYQGELGYLADVGGAGLKDITCSTSEVIRWIALNLADNPDNIAAHGISAGSMQLGYGLAVYGLSDILDVVIFVSGPVHADMVNACFTYSTQARGRLLDSAHDWVGNGDYCQNGGGPDWLIPILEADSIASSSPDQVRDYHYPNTKVVFLQGQEDEAAVALGRIFYDAITSEKSWIVLPGLGHELVTDPSGAAALVEELYKGLTGG